ncbi:GntR family transcriptional regulator [Streptomyces sp. NPDC048604]|uniref:GntR family transcriptional regulator n=1 Tax=Streptomyces sp. NPDC048604 TaxID=3365578 RepID=UPI003713FEA0
MADADPAHASTTPPAATTTSTATPTRTATATRTAAPDGPDGPDGPASTPLYLRVAEALRQDLARGRIVPGSRLPSERELSRRHTVNRQTVRSALQVLRDEGRVVTDRRGTFAARTAGHPDRVTVLLARRQVFPGGAETHGAVVRAALSWEPPPAALAAPLALLPGEPTLVHRQVVLTPDGAPVQRAESRFSRHALAQIPELARYRRGDAARHQPDLRLLYHWMHRAGLRVTHRESVGVTRRGPGGGEGTAAGPARLVVHRVVNDQHGNALEITDIDFVAQEAALTYEFDS